MSGAQAALQIRVPHARGSSSSLLSLAGLNTPSSSLGSPAAWHNTQCWQPPVPYYSAAPALLLLWP